MNKEEVVVGDKVLIKGEVTQTNFAHTGKIEIEMPDMGVEGGRSIIYLLPHEVEGLGESETLSQEWIEEHRVSDIDPSHIYVHESDLQKLLVPKQEITEEQAWEVISEKYNGETVENNIKFLEAQGYSVVKQENTEEAETVASVLADFAKSAERAKEVLSMGVETDD